MYSRTEVQEFEKLPAGAWLPKRISRKVWGSHPDTGKEYVALWEDYTLAAITLDPHLAEDTFSTRPDRLPVGTLVQDIRVGEEYTLGEGSVSSEVIDSIVENSIRDLALPSQTQPRGGSGVSQRNSELPLLQKEGIYAAGPEQSRPFAMRRGTTTWLIVLAGAALVGAGLLIAWRWQRRRQRRAQ